MLGFTPLAGGPLAFGPLGPISGGGGGAMSAQFRLLMDHFLPNTCGGAFYPAGSVITVGIDVPVDWVPTQAVDPLNQLAIEAYWNNGPINRGGSEPWRDQGPWGPQNGRFVGSFVSAPLVYWAPSGGNTYTLTGAGASLGPKAAT
jgi:hypothetical protein